MKKMAGNRKAMASQAALWTRHLDRQYSDRVMAWIRQLVTCCLPSGCGRVWRGGHPGVDVSNGIDIRIRELKADRIKDPGVEG